LRKWFRSTFSSNFIHCKFPYALSMTELAKLANFSSTVSKLGSEAGLLAETPTPLQTQIQGCREDIQQLSGEMEKVTLDQTDAKRSISTLVQICTGSKVGVEHFRNFNRAQHRKYNDGSISWKKCMTAGTLSWYQTPRQSRD
jgi:hypothetical protein